MEASPSALPVAASLGAAFVTHELGVEASPSALPVVASLGAAFVTHEIGVDASLPACASRAAAATAGGLGARGGWHPEVAPSAR